MNRKVLQLFLSVSLFLGIVLFLPQNAFALNSPQKISTSSNDNLAPAIVADSNGKVHVVWMDAPNGWGSSTTSLVHSFWNGQVWSTPTTIASGNFHELPSLAADSSGNVYLTWDADTNPNAWQIYYSKYNGTSWSTPVAISGSTAGDVAWDSEIAIDSSGNLHVAYTFIPAGTVGNQRFTYYTKWNGSLWTTPINLTESGTFHQFPTIGADSAGKVHVVWKSTTSDNSSYQIVHRVWNGTSWSATASISGVVSQINDTEPRIAIGTNNNAHVVWEERIDPTSSSFNIKYSKFNGTSPWSSPFVVSSVGQETIQGVPSVAVLRSSIDDVLIGWIDKTTTPLQVGFRKYNATTASWEVARTNTINQASADFPVAAMDKWDNIHVAWGEINTSGKHDLEYDAIPLANKVIDSTGGTLTTFNGDTLTIPAGATSSATIISAQIAPLSQAAPSGSNTPNRQYIFEPSGITFASPISAKFTYTDAEVAGIDERTLGIYVWDTPTSSWVFKTGNVNRAQNFLTVSLDHFSIYGLFGTHNNVSWSHPLDGENLNELNTNRTVPARFHFITAVANPNTAKMQIVDELGKLHREYTVGTTENSINYNSNNQEYMLNLQAKDFTLGNYQLKVLYDGLVRGSADLLIK